MERKTVWDGYNRIGEDVFTTDRDGLTHIAHYDSHNQLIGRSYETRDNRGEIYMIHEDARGNRLGRSTLERDWWGDYYVKTEETARDRQNRQEETHRDDDVSGADAGDGCLGSVLYGVIMGAIKICLYLYVGVAVVTMGGTVWMFPLMQWLNNSGNASLEWFWILSVPIVAYFPYLGIHLFRRIKKQTKWKQFFLSVLLWALIGPFAYLILFRKKKADNLPRPGKLPDPAETKNYCPGCGQRCKPGQRFCSHCGAALRSEL